MEQLEDRYISLLTENSVKAYRDIKNSIDTAQEDGMAKGLEQGRAEGIA